MVRADPHFFCSSLVTKGAIQCLQYDLDASITIESTFIIDPVLCFSFAWPNQMTLLLYAIVNEHRLRLDKDIRNLLTLAIIITEVDNIIFFREKGGCNNRYTSYLKEMQAVNSSRTMATAIRMKY